ncbi:hypothetical protein PsYK624_061630 [Phanerochaete sordida]|uniref:Uncharacterized protein n=1 Tax=Phanerochaete sordida TaxID=48140 RepID=A0A9P3LDK9_9APHY|nr:hypothetical protein PsYK624_061630 [Phanerochaete sordida]
MEHRTLVDPVCTRPFRKPRPHHSSKISAAWDSHLISVRVILSSELIPTQLLHSAARLQKASPTHMLAWDPSSL